MGDERSFPDEHQAEDDQRHIDQRVAQQQNIEDAPRIIAKSAQEIAERSVLFFEPLDLMALEREQRRLQTRKKRRAENEKDDRAKENAKTDRRHPSVAAVRGTALLRKRMRAGLPVISAETRLSFPVNKGQRISRLVEELSGAPAEAAPDDIAQHPCYLGFFRCWNEQRYYEAHDVLEHLWLRTESEEANYFKGLIQAAGGFVHLQKQYQRPTHPKDGRRMYPAVRLFRLAEKNLTPYLPMRHQFDVENFLHLLRRQVDAIVASDYRQNPWTPEAAAQIALL